MGAFIDQRIVFRIKKILQSVKTIAIRGPFLKMKKMNFSE